MLVPHTLFRAADRLAEPLRLLDKPFDERELIETARRRAGSRQAATDDVLEPLGRWLTSLATEARLSVFGRISARWDALRLLANLLRFREEERQDPAIAELPVPSPIFITGLPRSGTTFLHSLFAEDPGNRVPRCWQTIYPYPLAGEAPTDTARRRQLVDRQFRTFARLAPELLSVHPLSADVPQECSEITAHVFQSLRFDTTHTVPSYTAWLDRVGHLEAYHFHKRFLQHLQHQYGTGPWVLKCPDHVFALDAIATVYPDARFVFVHRNPVRILASVARLTEILREPFTRRIDRLAIGRQVAERWLDGARRITDASTEGRFAPQQVSQVHYDRLIRDPLGTVSSLYRHFGMDLNEPAMERMRAFLAARPRGGYGNNEYRLEDFGLDPEGLREGFRGYTSYFGIATEARNLRATGQAAAAA
ncbi:MAG: sulfotransferase [Acetobacteraceae bacterium]|nr:sulfotransferase [Acetobacteraceae bacterium]